MKKLKVPEIFSNKYVKYSLLLILGIFIGWIFFHPSPEKAESHDHSGEAVQGTIWTCSMHPQIRMSEPGDCPICGMDLIPLARNGDSSVDPDAIQLTREAAQLANVLTSTVTKQKPVKEVRLYGKVQADERLLQSQVAHVPGRIERLAVNFTGESVRKGQVLASIYSPEMVTAQQELLEAAKTRERQPAIYEAARERLRQWKLTDNLIESIESSGITRTEIEVVSNTSGIVTERLVNTGDYVSQGTALFKIADLSKVWIMFDAYESDLQFLRKGMKVTFTLQALPGADYSGTIAFIDPVIDPVTRVAKVRVETNNPSGKLKPEMFAAGTISSTLNEYRDNINIPRSAVLWTGKRSIVYVKQPETDEPIFKIREVELGPMLGDSYVITDGLSEGEEIVTRGTFSVDAAAQLGGKSSMMNPGGGKTSSIKINVTMDFTRQLNTVFDKYIVLKNALVQSDPGKAKQAARNVQLNLANTDMNQLTGDIRAQWTDLLPDLKDQNSKIASSEDLEEQRKAFSAFNEIFYKAIKTFGLMDKTVYYQFCPMANDGKGAYWLSDSIDIQNPYYGKSMLTCGETKETLKF
jgi:Cu(I)/Ag(I) efflux system membrane fusion protein